MRSKIIKSVSMAYGASGKSNKIFLKQFFEKYSHLGERNFITYAYNASMEKYKNGGGELKDGMKSPAIKRQLSRHFSILKNTLESKNEQRIIFKKDRNKKAKSEASIILVRVNFLSRPANRIPVKFNSTLCKCPIADRTPKIR